MGMRRRFVVVALAVGVLAGLPMSTVSAAEPEPAAAESAAPADGVNVQILGAVAKPGRYRLAPPASRLTDLFIAAGIRLPTDDPRNMPLTEIAAATGSCSVLAGNLRTVYVARTAGEQRTFYAFDLARAHDDPRHDPLLRDGDVVYVPQCRRPGIIRQIVEPLPVTAR
jgi:protein involved in polysaccharide export with SLBB domain